MTISVIKTDTQCMHVELITLESLREVLSGLSKQDFVRKYPGAFLLAMGFLAVEAIRARRRAVRTASDGFSDETAAVTFGTRLRHDPLSTHPLAGCAFFLRPTARAECSLTLGRSPACDITVPDPSVSERHCRIEITTNGVIVVDTKSTNGTAVNLERVPSQGGKTLADEDFLSVGRYTFQLLAAATLYDELNLLEQVDFSEA